jgi:hypothetical protein
MKRRKTSAIVVEKSKFDAVLSQLVKAGPVPMKQIKTSGRRRSGQTGGEEMCNEFLVTGIEAQEVWRGAAPFDLRVRGLTLLSRAASVPD